MSRMADDRRRFTRSSSILLFTCLALLVATLPFSVSSAGRTDHDAALGVGTSAHLSPPVAPTFGVPTESRGLTHALGPAGIQRAASPPLGDDPRARGVIGTDDRFLVSPAIAPIAYLEIYGPGMEATGTCTGSFIGPHVLLTAAHCLYNPDLLGGWATDIAVVPGKDGPSEPYGWQWATNAWVPDDWVDSGTADKLFDWGLLVLPDDTLGDTVGWYSVGVLSDAALLRDDFTPTIVGYPGDKPDGTQWGGFQPAFSEVLPFVLRYTIDTAGGQSGSAIFRPSDAVIVGIHVRGSPSVNEGTRIDQWVLDDLINGCGQVGCTFAYFVEAEPIEPDLQAFQRTWERTDMAVAQGIANRTWVWGPSSITDITYERYDDATAGQRVVVYWDKSRMEITYPEGDSFNEWYVTNGLLAWELITGQMQVGDAAFVQDVPAQVNVAGDSDDPTGPTYATFNKLLDFFLPFPEPTITRAITRDGVIFHDQKYAAYGVGTAIFVKETGHWIAQPFWDFMNSEGVIYQHGAFVTARMFESPYYAAGLPISEPFWATVKIGGTYRDVMVQCFERRCLTYTPGNPPGWDVEAGNVGRHYYIWRYGVEPGT